MKVRIGGVYNQISIPKNNYQPDMVDWVQTSLLFDERVYENMFFDYIKNLVVCY